MHEYYRMEARKNEVWFARQVASMEAKSETSTAQQAADENFWFRVVAALPIAPANTSMLFNACMVCVAWEMWRRQ